MKNVYDTNEQPEKLQRVEKMAIGRGGVQIAESRLGYFNIDVNNFFKDDDKSGFIYKSDFLLFIYSLKKGQLETWKKVFELMDTEVHIKVSTLQKPHGEGRTSMLCRYFEKDIEYSIDLMLASDLYRLVWQYSFSLLNCHVSLDRLYNKALGTL